MKQTDTSGLTFRRLREGDKYYVDKSLLIKDILDENDNGVYLFTRPRRFGKTTNLSMLDAFFNLRYRGNRWFDGLAISGHPEYDAYRNAFPVVHLDLRPTKAESFDEFLGGLRTAVLGCYRDHHYLFETDGADGEVRYVYETLMRWETPTDPLKASLVLLCKALERYHGRKVVVLIDEYDSAVADSFGSESHRPIMTYLGRFLNPVLKNNDSLQIAYITGIMQIAKESMFSDLNGLVVNNVFSRSSDERFGFTEDEVRGILGYYGHPERLDEVRDWYDGYRFGGVDVYNPYSIMCYVSRGFIPEPYWVNSGGDSVVRWLLDRTDDGGLADLVDIVNGGSSRVRMRTPLTYSRLDRDNESIYSLMAMAGYLNAVPVTGDVFDVSIPNREVRGLFSDIIHDMSPMGTRLFQDFNRAMLDGDAGRVEQLLRGILQGGSYLNLDDEKSYVLILMTIMHALTGSYEVVTESESGNGRTDILLRPRDGRSVPMVFELKRVRSDADIERGLDEAMAQIHSRRYYNGMSGRVVLVAMCFHGKIPGVRIDTVTIGPHGVPVRPGPGQPLYRP